MITSKAITLINAIVIVDDEEDKNHMFGLWRSLLRNNFFLSFFLSFSDNIYIRWRITTLASAVAFIYLIGSSNNINIKYPQANATRKFYSIVVLLSTWYLMCVAAKLPSFIIFQLLMLTYFDYDLTRPNLRINP